MNNLMSAGDLVAFVLYQMELGFALEVRLLCCLICFYCLWQGIDCAS